MAEQTQKTPPPEEQPSYWFVLLDAARWRDDYATAAKAEAELRRLGVKVKFERATAKGAAHAR